MAKGSIMYATRRLDAVGMPVGLLKYMLKQSKEFWWPYSFEIAPWASISYVLTTWNSLYITKNVNRYLLRTRLGGDPGESSAIQELYHEMVHAYLDVREGDAKFKKFIKEGRDYYKNAPLTGTKKTVGSNRVFQEAIAEYVAHRVEARYNALDWTEVIREMLQEKVDKALNPPDEWFDKWKSTAQKIPKQYKEKMSKRAFGYGKLGDRQYQTSKPIAGYLKKFCDEELLEGKVKRISTRTRNSSKDGASF